MNDLFILPLSNTTNACIVDSFEKDRLMLKKWCVDAKGYVVSTCINHIYLSKFIARSFDSRYVVDHKNRIPLDNRGTNLRVVTRSFNNQNGSKRNGLSSKYKGVYFNKKMKKFASRIRNPNIKDIYTSQLHLGYFTNEIDAAKAYNNKATELYGPDALLNDLSDDTNPIHKLV